MPALFNNHSLIKYQCLKFIWVGYCWDVKRKFLALQKETDFFLSVSVSVSVADWTYYDRVRDCSESACGWVGGDSGVWHHIEASLGPWAHGYEEPGQQLLPQLGHASALHHPWLPGKVSNVRFYWLSVKVSHSQIRCLPEIAANIDRKKLL